MEHKLKTIPVGVGNWPIKFNASSEQIKETKDWDVGGKYRLIIEVEQKSLSKNIIVRAGRVSNGFASEFEITKYKYLPEKDIMDMDDKEFGAYQNKVLG